MMRVRPQGEFRDRSTWLVVFGIAVILVGVACALLAGLTALLMVMTMIAPPSDGAAALQIGLSPRAAIPSLSLYAILTAVFITLGVGSIRARRWARELLLVIAWIWLLTGISSLLIGALVWTSLLEFMLALSGLPFAMAAGLLLSFYLLMTVIHVAVPAVMVVFYRSPDVVATCEARDSGDRLYASRPTHLLSLCILYVLLSYSALLLPVYGLGTPFFGVPLTGAAGIAVIVATGILYLWLAWASFKRQMAAWWIGAASTVVVAVSTTLTAHRVSIAEMLESMPLSKEELAVMQVYGSIDTSTVVLISIVSWASMLGYQLYVKQLFNANDSTGGHRD